MERHVNGYQGMNKDIAYDSIEQSQYVDATDIRISTTSGESLGAFINIKGNSYAFNIPTSGTFNSINWSAINPEIIGYTTIRNRIILFVADESDTKGWIYDLQYNPASLEILSGFPALKYYNSGLLFKKQWPIEALGRYETDCVQRVYWTDYNNFFRSINIEEPNLETLPLGQVDIFPDVTYTQPILTVVSGGGALLSGEYQVAYRLVTADGKQTLVAPPSNMIHIVAASETLNQSAKYNGDIIQVNTGKSITIEIDTSNYQDFDKIEFIIAYYETNIAIPVVQSIEFQSIGGANTVLFNYTGTEGSAFDIELFNFALKNHAFKTCKTLTQKDSSLVIANIKGSQVSINNLLGTGTFEAKTRRYKYNGGTPIPPFTPGTTVNDLANAFNTDFNSDAHWLKDWHDNKQYKYQSDGVTLGGQGANISYKFHLEKFTLDGSGTDGFANVSNNPDYVYTHDFNDGYGVYPNTTYPNFASPFLSGLMRGYKRGETYRFGIIFYTNKGEATYVEYIGDIKFPDISEEDSAPNSSGSNYWPIVTQDPLIPQITYGYSMGIEFTIDFSTCPDLLNNVTSYQIVRVKRTDVDKRRLTQGFIKGFYYNPIGTPNFSDFDLRMDGNENGLHLYPYYPQCLTDDPFNPGFIAPKGNATFATLEDYEGLPDGTVVANGLTTVFHDYLIKGQYLGFYSPEISYNATNVRNLAASISNNPCLLVTGGYTSQSTNIIPAQDLSADNLGDYCLDERATARKCFPVTYNSIHNIKKYSDNELFSMTDTINYEENVTGLFGSYYMRNYWAMDNFERADQSPGPRLNHPNEGGNTDIPEIEKAGTSLVGLVSKFSNDPLTGLPVPANSQAGTDYFDAPYYNLDANGNQRLGPLDLTGTQILSSAPFMYPIVDLVLPKKEIYGGYTTNALEVNIFIPASPVISTGNTNPIVYGGDIFISMFTAQPQMTEFHTEFYTGTNRYRRDNSLTEVYPVETSMNIDLATGATIKTEVKYTFSGSERIIYRQEINNSDTTYGKTVSMYSYMPVYSRENDQINFFTEPANAKDCLVNDIRAYLSSPKVNDETIDSWTKFATNNFYDIDDYGPINKIVNWKDTVFFIQDRGFGAYAINRSAITSTNDGVATSLGTGQGFGKHEYHSKEHGSIHQWGVKTTDKGIYLFDAIHKKIFVFSTTRLAADNSPLSEVKGVHSLLQNLPAAIFDSKANGGDNPILFKGVQIARDKVNDEVLFTFLGSGDYTNLSTSTEYQVGDIVFLTSSGLYYVVTTAFTSGETKPQAIFDLLANSEILKNPEEVLKNTSLIYDELIQQFSCRYSATPSIYLENGNILLSPSPGKPVSIFTHNIGNYGEFYGNVKEASLTMVINPNADLNKVLRFLEYSSIVRDDAKVIDRTKTITAFQVSTQYQTTGKIPFSADRIKRKFDRWRIKIPRDLNSTNQKGRFRATYFELTVYFDNLENKELIMNRMMSYYDIQIF